MCCGNVKFVPVTLFFCWCVFLKRDQWMAQRMPASLELSIWSQAHQGTCGNAFYGSMDACIAGMVDSEPGTAWDRLLWSIYLECGAEDACNAGTVDLETGTSWDEALCGSSLDTRIAGMVDLETGASMDLQLDACIDGTVDSETGTSREQRHRELCEK